MKAFLQRLFLLLVFAPVAVFAVGPSYTGTAFDKVQTASEDATLFFGVVVVLAVLVTGFFVGRKWLRSVG